MGLLPTIKSVKKTDDPRNLILFGLPKVGKTTALSKLPDCLIIDLESGTDYVSGYITKANNYVDLYKIARALNKTWKGKPNEKYEEHNFKFIVIDTITALEEMSLDLACKRYKESQLGRNFEGTGQDILKLPSGAGYYWQRIAIQEILEWFQGQEYNLIVTGHVKDKNITEGGTEMVLKTLDLGGKISNILSAKSDAICYLYRDVDTGSLMANFGDMNAVLTGARMPHLAGKIIELAERKMNDKTGEWEIVTHWDRIFPSLKTEEVKNATKEK